MNFDLFNLVLVPAAMLSAVFAIVMAVWMWRTRPARTVPAYRRTAADVYGQYPGPTTMHHQPAPMLPRRTSVDGRRRDMARAM